MDIISEIIAYEKHAEKIVAEAEAKADTILSEAAAVREQERIKYEEDRRNAIDKYHSELKISGEEHYYATNDECNAQKKRLDDEFSKNGGRWADEIFSNIVSAV